MRTTPEENAELGRILAEKVNAATGPVAVLLPLRGLSQLDAPGGEFWWPEADCGTLRGDQAACAGNSELIELDANINDPPSPTPPRRSLLDLIKRYKHS